MDKAAGVLGFTVIPFDFPDKVMGRIFIERGVKTIAVNKRHPVNRQRFTVAHELGHYLSGHPSDEEGERLTDDEFDFHEPVDRQEKEADAFAAELLMPKPFLARDLDKFGLDMPRLTELYQVSERAMWVRLISLGFAERYAKVKPTT